jgi:DNA-binding Xre family transcriptional regulator
MAGSHPLDDLRLRSARTVEEVTRQAGITRSAWYKLKGGKGGVYFRTVAGLAAALPATIEEIMERLG